MAPLDRTDSQLLLALDSYPQATTVALAAELKLARNTVQTRLRKLNDGDLLGPHSQRVDPEALGYPLLALVTMSISQQAPPAAALVKIPEVVELLAITGEGDLMARVVARDTDDLHRVTELMLRCPGVVRTNTCMVLKRVAPMRVHQLLKRAVEDD